MSGLYIHIPFCHSKCAYCDFFSTPSATQNVDDYIEALIRELKWRADEIDLTSISTIYLGGGTPSIISGHQLDRLMRNLPTANAHEITFEVNPEDVTPDKVRQIVSTGINRVSMGVQTLNDSQLSTIGRRHSAADAIKAIEILRNGGVNNLSIDLIFGLPGQTISDWDYALNTILSLRPEHLSAYSLMYEPGTRLWAMLQAGMISETPQELSEQMYLHLCDAARGHGYKHYEISNFALPGFHSRHNSSYWNLTPYLGIGVAAHSYDGRLRRSNPISIAKYVAASGPIYDEELLSESERIDEYLLIRLRTAEGLRFDDFEQRFGAEALRRLRLRAERQPLLTINDDSLRISENQWLIADSILVNLFED